MNSEQQSKFIPPTPPSEILQAPKIGVVDDKLPDINSSRATAVTAAHTDFAAFEQGYISQYINLADTKATWSFAIASGAIVYLISKNETREQLLHAALTPEFSLVLSPICLLLISAACSFLTIVPRRSTSGEGLVFYGGVAQYRSASNYVDSVTVKSASDLTELRLAHCFDIAEICNRKYEYLRKAMWLGVIGLAAAAAPLIKYG